jgi:hypothetical protein
MDATFWVLVGAAVLLLAVVLVVGHRQEKAELERVQRREEMLRRVWPEGPEAPEGPD